MKKQWLITGILAAVDQTIKLLIAHFAIDKMIIWIPSVLRFEPFQNTNLNWFASMANFKTPVIGMIFLQITAIAGLLLFFRFQTYKVGAKSRLLSGAFCFASAGILCSFIDVVFWGGSLDFIGLFNWFIFDTKDVFLNTGWILALIWTWRHEKKLKKSYSNDLNTEDIAFAIWFRSGCKLLPNTTSEYTRI